MKDMNAKPTIRRRIYTDQEQADALAALQANGGNVNRTAAALGIPEPTLRMWASGTRRPFDRALYEQSKTALADRFEAIISQAIGVVQEKLPDASAAQAAVIAAIATDKMLLLRRDGDEGHTVSATATESAALSPDALAAARVLLAQVFVPSPSPLDAAPEPISPYLTQLTAT